MQGSETHSPVNYLKVFTHRKLLIIIVTAITAIVSVGFARVSVPVYTATATLSIAFQDPSNTNSTLPALLQEEYMATQIGIISSKYMAEKVLTSFSVQKNPIVDIIRSKFKDRPESADDESLRGAIKRWMLKKLRVYVHNKSTRLVKVAFESDSRKVAIEIADEFSKQYLNAALELNLAPIKKSANWLEDNAKPIREALDEAEQVLGRDSPSDVSNDVIDEVESSLCTAQKDLNSLAEILIRRVKSEGGECNNEFLIELRKKMLEKNQELIEISSSRGGNSKEYLVATNQVKELKSAFIEEFKKQIKSIKVSLASLNRSLVFRSSVTQSNVALLNTAGVDVDSTSVSEKTAGIYGAILGLMLGVILAFFSVLISSRR